jgi:hypothetical protein
MGDLVKRLRIKARQASEAARMMAEAKSLRQESNPERRADLYMWPTPEQTVEWQAAEAITALQSQLAEARAERDAADWLEAEMRRHLYDKSFERRIAILEAYRSKMGLPMWETRHD